MNFKQAPGLYDAETDKLIINFEDAIKKELIIDSTYAESEFTTTLKRFYDKEEDRSIALMDSDFKEPFYIILPDDIIAIENDCFKEQQSNLIGIYGKNVQTIYENAFGWSNYPSGMEEMVFPNLKYFETGVFIKSSPFYEKYAIQEDGLITIGNILVDIDKEMLKSKTLEIPENIKLIRNDLFSDPFLDLFVNKIILPIELNECAFEVNEKIKEFTLPIKFNILKLKLNSETKLIYKGTKGYLKNNLKLAEKEIDKRFIIESDSSIAEKFNKKGYEIEEIESLLDRKLTLDELLNMGKSFKEAGNYFKNAER